MGISAKGYKNKIQMQQLILPVHNYQAQQNSDKKTVIKFTLSLPSITCSKLELKILAIKFTVFVRYYMFKVRIKNTRLIC